jgi:hypothetical protein
MSGVTPLLPPTSRLSALYEQDLRLYMFKKWSLTESDDIIYCINTI